MSGRRHRNADDHSVSAEPHIGRRDRSGAGVCARCGSALTAVGTSVYCTGCARASAAETPGARIGRIDSEAEQAHAGVWNEPALVRGSGREAPDEATTYATWLSERLERRGALSVWLLVVIVAVAAGPLSVLGVFVQSFVGVGSLTQTFSGYTTVIVFGPVLEEVMKVALMLFLLESRPYLVPNRSGVLLVGLASGLGFAAIENVLYLFVYIPNPEPWLVTWRWTVCVALHVGCTLIASIGIASAHSKSVRELKEPDFTVAVKWIVAAAVVHGLYNGTVVVLEVAGVF